MSTGRLHGADHATLGEIATLAEGPAGIAISRGGSQKRYAYRDPNEDAVGFALSDWGAVAVVADGHGGHHAARIAVDRVLDTHAPRWLGAAPIALEARFPAEAAAVALDLNNQILNVAGELGVRHARTTLSIALVRPAESWAAVLCIGDSHVFLIDDASRAVELLPSGGRELVFLGDATNTPERLAETVRVETCRLDEARAIVLATDGLSEIGIGVSDPAAAAAHAVDTGRRAEAELRPLAAARDLAEAALDAQRAQRAGDNVATGVLWLEPRDGGSRGDRA